MRRHLLTIDWWLLAPVIVLLALSLTTLFSLSPVFFKSQLLYWGIGAFFFILFSCINIEVLKKFATPFYLFSLISLAIVLVIGLESHGAVRWISIFGGTIQLSEICKPLLAISFASYLSETTNTKAISLFLILLFLAPIVLLIYLQPDLGNAIIYAATVIIVLIVFGFRLRWFFISAVPFLFSLPFLWLQLHEYQRLRVISFFHPSSATQTASYNAMQAIIAVGSGMFTGRGLSEGTQSGLRFLPERQTDFIFASMTEELGFIGAMILLAAFVFLLYRMYMMYLSAESTYVKMLIAAIFSLFLIHVFLNIGMNIGVVPIVGVTLPFVSFGGSSLLANSILLGILTSLGRTLPHNRVLEIK